MKTHFVSWIVAALLPAVLSAHALAADKYWVGPSGSWWDFSTNWSATPGGAGGAGQPADGESAYITKNSATDYTVFYFNTLWPSAVHPYVVIDQVGAGIPTLETGPFPHTLTADMFFVGEHLAGNVVQERGIWTAESVLAVGRNTASTGAYDLQDGKLVSGTDSGDSVEIGRDGTGTFTHSGGTHTAQATLYLGYGGSGDGTYIMNDDYGTPQLDSTTVYVGYDGSGLFQQYAGTHHATGDLRMAHGRHATGGTYELHGGTLQVDGNVTVGSSDSTTACFKLLDDATATFGGDLAIASSVSSAGEVVLNAGTLTVKGDIIGDGAGVLSISAIDALGFQGSAITVDTFIVGQEGGQTGSHTTYAGEAITCRQALVGDSGNGLVVVQNGGSLHCTEDSYLGVPFNGRGQIIVQSGSSVTMDADLYLGTYGAGHLSVYDGGTVTIGDDLIAANEVGSDSDITLYGGALNVNGSLYLGGIGMSGGTASMTIETGATVNVGSYLDVGQGSELVIAGGTFRMPDSQKMQTSGGTITFGAGTVELTYVSIDLKTEFLDALLGPGHALRDGQQLLCTGGGYVDLQDQLVLDGGTFSATALLHPEALRFERGRFNKLGGNLVVGATGTFGELLTVRDQQHYHADAAVEIAPEGRLELDGGRLSAGAGVLVNGLLTGDGHVDASLTNAGGEVRVEAGKTLTFTGVNNINAGQMRLLGGAAVFTHTLANAAGGDITGRGVLVSEALINAGDIGLSNDVTDVYGDVLNDTTGRIIISGRGDVTFWDDVTNNGALFTVADDSSATFFGEFAGSGITGGGHKYFEDDVTPGASPAAIDFGGDVSFGPLAQLNTELGGRIAGDEYDQVNVAGTATLSGTLAVSLIDNFEPAAGDEFAVVTYGSRSGEFAAITGWEHGKLAHLAFYGANALTLHCTYFGDANVDYQVDLLDLTLLANNWDQSPRGWGEGDFNGDGNVDLLDLTLLANNWDAGGALTVPEPATLALLAIGGLAMLKRKRKP